MKTASNTLLLLICILFTSTVNSQTLFPGISKEYPIDFDNPKSFMKKGEIKDKIKKFNNRVRRRNNTGKNISGSKLTIPAKSFKFLYDIAKEKSDLRYNGRSSLTGFIMHFGLDSNYKIELFFQPWYYDSIEVNLSTKYLMGDIVTIDDAVVYQFIGNKFDTVGIDKLVTYQERFRQSLAFQFKKERGRYRNFQSNFGDHRDDTQSAYFTFQELEDLYDFATSTLSNYSGDIHFIEGVKYKNREERGRLRRTGRTSNKPYSNKIVSMMTTDGVIVRYIKHLKGFEIPDDIKFVPTEYANLSGLCPPGCNGFEFNLQ